MARSTVVLGLITVAILAGRSASSSSAETRQPGMPEPSGTVREADRLSDLLSRELWISSAKDVADRNPNDGQAVASAFDAATPGQFIYGRPGRLVAYGQDDLDCSRPHKGVVWVVPGTTYDGSYVVDHLGCDELLTTRAGGLLLARGPHNLSNEPPNLTITETFDSMTPNGVAFSPGGPGGVVSALQVNSIVPTPPPESRSAPPQWTRHFVWGLTSFVFDGGRAAPGGLGGAQHVALTGQLERTKRANDDDRPGNIGFGVYGHVGSPNDQPSSTDGSLVGAEIDVAAHNLDQSGARAELAVNCADDGPGSGAQCGHGILFGDEDQGRGKPAAFNTSLVDAAGAKYLTAGVDLAGMQPVQADAETGAPQPSPTTLQLMPPLSRVAPGEEVSGRGIQPGTIVRLVDPVTGQVTLSKPAVTTVHEAIAFASHGPALRVGDGRGIQMDTAGVFRLIYDAKRRWTEITVGGIPKFAIDADGRVHVHATPIADLP